MSKTAVVNFELFFIPPEDHFKTIMAEIPDDCDTVLCLLLADGLLYKGPEFFEFFDLIKSKHPDKKFQLVVGMSGNDETINFNFNLNETYQSYTGATTYGWNSNSGKFLFLGGVPSRFNRIVLLKKFYEAGLLDRAEWSFFKPWTGDQEYWCRQALQDYTDEEYNKFLNDCERKIDDVYESSKEYGTDPQKQTFDWCEDPAWINPEVYRNTTLSIISEGVPDNLNLDTHFLTEKTWRVFVQRHPFLLAGTPDMMDYIKYLGLRTFEKYMAIPDYAYIENEFEKYDAIVKNTEQFLKDCHKYREEIDQDIDYNYYRFMQLADDNKDVLYRVQNYFNLDQETVDYWFNQKGFAHLLRMPNAK